jgi:hypothetical protein
VCNAISVVLSVTVSHATEMMSEWEQEKEVKNPRRNSTGGAIKGIEVFRACNTVEKKERNKCNKVIFRKM